jgi:hypothetical protein
MTVAADSAAPPSAALLSRACFPSHRGGPSGAMITLENYASYRAMDAREAIKVMIEF